LLVESKFFIELRVENSVIRCFKWFSNVLLRLKPSSFDFEIVIYRDIELHYPFSIAFASEGKRKEFLCYKSDLLRRQ